MALLLEPRDEPSRSLQCQVEIIDAKEQEEAVAWCRGISASQGGVLVSAPFVQAEQDGPVRVQNLTEVVMLRMGRGLTKERLNHLKLDRTSFTPIIVQVRFMQVPRRLSVPAFRCGRQEDRSDRSRPSSPAVPSVLHGPITYWLTA